MKNISEYANQIDAEERASAEVKAKERNDRWMARKAKVQAIIDQNIPLLASASADRRARLRDWALRYDFQDKFAGMVCDKCSTEMIVHYESIGFGDGTREIYDCLGCGFSVSVNRRRR